MKNGNKSTHIQLRVSPKEKQQIAKSAKRSGLSLSAWILNKVLSEKTLDFQVLMRELGQGTHDRVTLAAFSDFLDELSRADFDMALEQGPQAKLSALHLNTVAAMVEHVAQMSGFAFPQWTKKISPLEKPWFASNLKALRCHLLVSSPAAYKRRNLFVDSTVGDRV